MNRIGSFLKGASALALAALVGMAAPAHAQEREFNWLEDGFELPSGEGFDVDALMEMMPSGLTVSYDEAEFDDDVGATIIEEVEIAFDRLNGLAIEIEELVVWGLDMDYLGARLAGEDAGTSGRVARRIEAYDVELTGFEEMYAGFLEAYSGAVEGSLENLLEGELDEDAAEALSLELGEFEVSMDLVVLDEFGLREWELDLVDGETLDENWATLMPYLQRYAAWNRVFEFGGVAMEGIDIDFAYSSGDLSQSGDFGIDRVIYEGYRGADVKLNVIEGLYGYFDMELPEDEGLEDMGSLSISFEINNYVVEGMELDKLMGFLARGEMPAMDETDLLSLGTWTTEDSFAEFNGRPFYSVEKSVTELDEWHWLVPTRIRASVTNLTYDIEGYVGSILDMVGEDDLDREDMNTFYDVVNVLDDYDLARPSFDYSVMWDWSPETGKASAGLGLGLDGYQRMALLLTGGLPDYDSVADTVADDFSAVDNDSLREALEQMSSLASLRMEIIDEGGFEKAFPMIIDMAKLFEGEEGAEFLANATPDSLRSFVTGGITFGAERASEIVPQAPAFATELVNFIEAGGRFSVRVEPSEPISSETADELEEIIDAEDAEALIDYLGVEIEHQGD
jgi:hypothetical protein